jgi:ATP synthase protein I
MQKRNDVSENGRVLVRGGKMKFEKEVMQNLAMITQLGISMLAPIILCVFAGHWLDERFGFHSVTVLLLFGMAAGIRNCYLILKQLVPKKGEKKHGR